MPPGSASLYARRVLGFTFASTGPTPILEASRQQPPAAASSRQQPPATRVGLPCLKGTGPLRVSACKRDIRCGGHIRGAGDSAQNRRRRSGPSFQGRVRRSRWGKQKPQVPALPMTAQGVEAARRRVVERGGRRLQSGPARLVPCGFGLQAPSALRRRPRVPPPRTSHPFAPSAAPTSPPPPPSK